MERQDSHKSAQVESEIGKTARKRLSTSLHEGQQELKHRAALRVKRVGKVGMLKYPVSMV